MLVHRGQRYRVYPTLAQIARADAWEGALRWLWNHAHTERLAKLEHGYLQPSAFDQIGSLTVLRAGMDWLRDVPRDVCAQLLVELDRAWQRFFAGLADRPRYKCKTRGDRAPLIAPQDFRTHGRKREGVLTFPKLGDLRTVLHRPVPGRAKTCALVREGSQWYASIACEVEIPDPAPSTKPPVGLDRGVVNLLADSDGNLTPNPRFLEQARGRLKTLQRRTARKKKGSQNQKRARERTAKLHRKARRQREAVLHRTSKHYAKSHGVVVVERLDLGNMTASARGTVEAPGTNVRQKAGLNRAILDGGWSRFVEMLRYKVVPEGGKVIDVNPAYSSQECHACGHVDAANRPSQSKFQCVACGHRDHADVNAAKVILRCGTHGAEGFGGDGKTRPVRKQLRVVRRGTRHVDQGHLSIVKAPAFMQG